MMPMIYFIKKSNYQWFKGKRINNNNTHGTGCTLSSAIASYLARGENLENAVKKAKDYISGALAAMLDLGQGQGPMDHGYVLDKKIRRIVYFIGIIVAGDENELL